MSEMDKKVDSSYLKLLLREMVADYGVHDSIAMVASAMQEYSDDMSDQGLKEKAVQAASMADVLRDLNGDSN